MKSWEVFGIFVFVRLLSVILVQTFFVPDEYWQSLEVAHKIAFGYGYLTWEWKLGIRSYFYPAIFTGLYKILKLLELDNPVLLIYGPRLLQAILSAYSDLCFYHWSGSRKWGIFCLTTSWFWFYTSSRTLINTFECSLSVIALSKFPWLRKSNEQSCKFLWIVAILSVARPTAVIMWAPLCLYHLAISKDYFTLILTRYVPIGFVALAASTILDSWLHGSFIITGFEFLKHNVYYDVGSWYGQQPWHWYLSNGFPAILGIYFIPFLFATSVVIKNRYAHPNELALLATIFCTLGIYSMLPHKEFRFILPLLPIVLYIVSRFLAAWSCKANKLSLWLAVLILFIGNIFPAYYLGFIHQRGTLDVMSHLRNISAQSSKNTSILFLMPCHSTPLYSHLHINISTRFLTCQPDLEHKNDVYVDEADQFYSNPSSWLRKEYPPNGVLPSHIVTFDSLVPQIGEILSRYRMTQQLFHTSIPTQRVGRYVLLFERINFD